MKKTIRHLNGYKLIYKPEWPSSMKSKNWNGWIYEHRFLAEQELGRTLGSDEVVHHKDHDRANNTASNLEVLTKSQHSIEHAPEKTNCKFCGKRTKSSFHVYCSTTCARQSNRKCKKRPSKDSILKLKEVLPMTKIGKLFGVSDNAVRKWLK